MSRVVWTRLIAMAFAVLLLVSGSAFFTASASAAPEAAVGAVYTLTNAAAGNSVLVYNRTADGTLHAAGQYSAGGNGTGAGLGSQGAVVLRNDNQWLFVVNAGSNTISDFAVQANGLKLVSTVNSGGTTPISLTVHKNWLYVLNAGGSGNIAGFNIDPKGQLTSNGSTQPLSGGSTGPAQVAFSPNGTQLAVTEKTTSEIDIYPVDANGLAGAPNTQTSSGPTPFGFAFIRHATLVVSEAGGAESAVSSYSVANDGTLTVDSPSVVAPGQQAACWLVVTSDGHYAYTTNAHSGTISVYSIDNSGYLTLGYAVAGTTGGSPTDMSLTADSQFLYNLNGSLHTIDAFSINAKGKLTKLASAAGLAAGVVGLAAR